MRGRKPKSRKVHMMNGNPSKKSQKDLKDSQGLNAGDGVPPCPRWLWPEGKAEWKRVVPELKRLGIISKIDRGILASYCQACAMLRDAVERLEKDGTIVMTKKNYPVQHPSVGIANTAMKQIKAFGVELGLSPVARLRIPETEPESSEDELERILSGGVIGLNSSKE